jgi:hypothetical protein
LEALRGGSSANKNENLRKPYPHYPLVPNFKALEWYNLPNKKAIDPTELPNIQFVRDIGPIARKMTTNKITENWFRAAQHRNKNYEIGMECATEDELFLFFVSSQVAEKYMVPLR